MQAAASRGRRILVDRQTSTIVWIEGNGNHIVPRGRYPGAKLLTVHEEMTDGRHLEIGQRFEI
jgi:hypothetical protein